jgi:hypothetical protein
MVPGAADRVVHDQPVGERTAVVAAGRADREDLRAPPHQDDRLILDVTQQRNTLGERIRRDAAGKIRPVLTLRLIAHMTSSPRSRSETMIMFLPPPVLPSGPHFDY